MTFIKQKNNFTLARMFFAVGVLVFMYVTTEVYLYSQTVSLRHDIINLGSKIESLRLENAALKNRFYSLTDQKSLTRLAKEKGLIQDNNPKWVFASRF